MISGAADVFIMMAQMFSFNKSIAILFLRYVLLERKFLILSVAVGHLICQICKFPNWKLPLLKCSSERLNSCVPGKGERRGGGG